jgi:hypothetical protein
MARRSRGDFKLHGLLRRIGNQMESDLRPAMVRASEMVLATQKDLIPKDTHKAEEALEAFVSKSGLDAQIGIRGKRDNRKFFYGKFLEYGTKQYKFGNGVMAARPAHPWPPSEAWDTPVPEILMAWDAKVDFLRATNPFGSGGGKDVAPPPPADETQDEKRARINPYADSVVDEGVRRALA